MRGKLRSLFQHELMITSMSRSDGAFRPTNLRTMEFAASLRNYACSPELPTWERNRFKRSALSR